MKKLYFFAVLLLTMTLSSSSFGAKIPAEALTQPEASVTPSLSPKDAFSEFKSLSRAERKERIKAAKKELKLFKQERKAGSDASTNTVLLVILAILLPPLAVYLHEGQINNKFWLSLILTLLFWIPGVIYALIVVLGK